MDAAQALADLTEISSQIRAAALIEGDGDVVASTLADEAQARDFAAAARELVTAAESVRSLGGEPLTQLEVATAAGSVFVVRDGNRAIAAATTAEPTVGLVFYDLKSCLRSAAEQPSPEAKPATDAKPAAEAQASPEAKPSAEAKPKRARKQPEEKAAKQGEETTGATSEGDDA